MSVTAKRVGTEDGRPSLPPRQGRPRHEFLEAAADRVGDADQGVQEGQGVALLDPAVRGHVDPGPPADVVLAQVVVLAQSSDLCAHGAAAGEDPFVGWGGARHTSTLPAA